MAVVSGSAAMYLGTGTVPVLVSKAAVGRAGCRAEEKLVSPGTSATSSHHITVTLGTASCLPSRFHTFLLANCDLEPYSDGDGGETIIIMSFFPHPN